MLGKTFSYDSCSSIQALADDQDRCRWWEDRFAALRIGMTRPETETILGGSQAFNRLIPAGISCKNALLGVVEVFYGPTISRSPYELPMDSSYAGLDVKPSMVLPSPTDFTEKVDARANTELPDGWKTRYEEVQIGMSRAECDRILGNAQIERPKTVAYGPFYRGAHYSSGTDTHKILIVFGNDGTVNSKYYFRDWAGYERFEPKLLPGLQP